jgi:hypothetical protein
MFLLDKISNSSCPALCRAPRLWNFSEEGADGRDHRRAEATPFFNDYRRAEATPFFDDYGRAEATPFFERLWRP